MVKDGGRSQGVAEPRSAKQADSMHGHVRDDVWLLGKSFTRTILAYVIGMHGAID